jgi:hypothetical protein
MTAVFTDSDMEEPTVDYSINWIDQKLEIIITNSIINNSKPLPSQKISIETENNKKLPYIVLKGIELLTIDSKTKGEDYFNLYPSIISPVFDLTSELNKVYSTFSANMKYLQTKYTLDIYPDIASLFIPHTRTSNILPTLDFIPSADFTGIVIYVDEKLPLYGKHSIGTYNPSLFPRVFDEKLNLVIGPLMVDPELIKESGTTAYQYLSEHLDIQRIGQNPMKLKARAIFGIHNTDLLISPREAEKILSRQNNLDLIKQGKILIIYNKND